MLHTLIFDKVDYLLEQYFSKASHRQFIRFVLTGLFCVGIEFLSLIAMVEIIGINYLFANLIAFTIAVVLNYFISRIWVFEAGRFSGRVEFVVFLITSSIGLGLNQLIMWVAVENIGIDYKISKIVAIGMVVVWNFLTKKFFVFKQ